MTHFRSSGLGTSGRAAGGDPAVDEANQKALRELGRLLPKLRAFALMLTGEGSAAEQLAGGFLDYARTKTPPNREPIGLQLWALTHIHTAWLQHQVAQRGKKSASGKPQFSKADREAFAAALGALGEGAEIATLLAALPAQQRATLYLVYGEGLSYDETADVFGSSLAMVMARLVRGHVAMAHWLEKKGLEQGARSGTNTASGAERDSTKEPSAARGGA